MQLPIPVRLPAAPDFSLMDYIGITPRSGTPARASKRVWARATAQTPRIRQGRLNEQCGRGVCFDVMIGRLALGHETAARALAESP
jgi:hypothetical protein